MFLGQEGPEGGHRWGWAGGQTQEPGRPSHGGACGRAGLVQPQGPAQPAGEVHLFGL